MDAEDWQSVWGKVWANLWEQCSPAQRVDIWETSGLWVEGALFEAMQGAVCGPDAGPRACGNYQRLKCLLHDATVRNDVREKARRELAPASNEPNVPAIVP